MKEPWREAIRKDYERMYRKSAEAEKPDAAGMAVFLLAIIAVCSLTTP